MDKQKFLKALKTMDSGSVMSFAAEQLGMSPAKFLMKNAGRLVLKAVKNGWAKAASIKDAVKDFSAKNVEDDSGIDYDLLDIDESTVKVKVLFAGKQGEELRDFVQGCMENLAEDAEEEQENETSEEEPDEESGVDSVEDGEDDFPDDGDEDEEEELDESERFFEAESIEDSMARVVVDGSRVSGFSAPSVISKAAGELGLSKKKLVQFIYGNVKPGSMMIRGKEIKLEMNLTRFVQQYASDPEKAAKNLIATAKTAEGKNALAEIAAKMYPDSADQFRDLGITVDGSLVSGEAAEKAISKAVDGATDAKQAVQAAGQAKAGAKAIVQDEELKKQVQDSTGIRGFTAFGWARLAAKTSGYILNHGKTLVDRLGETAVKKEEDKALAAFMTFIVDNGGDSDRNDTRFRVAFSADDLKWHATNLDNRKVRISEDKVIKAALGSEVGRKFKKSCLAVWDRIFRPEDGSDLSILPVFFRNFDGFDLDVKGKGGQVLDTARKMFDGYDKVRSEFS